MIPTTAAIETMRPLQNTPFRSISASGSNYNPRNTKCIPVDKILVFPELERNWEFFERLSTSGRSGYIEMVD